MLGNDSHWFSSHQHFNIFASSQIIVCSVAQHYVVCVPIFLKSYLIFCGWLTYLFTNMVWTFIISKIGPQCYRCLSEAMSLLSIILGFFKVPFSKFWNISKTFHGFHLSINIWLYYLNLNILTLLAILYKFVKLYK